MAERQIPPSRHHALAARAGRAGWARRAPGPAHWWAQRLTALALVPLTLWFICVVIRTGRRRRATMSRLDGTARCRSC